MTKFGRRSFLGVSLFGLLSRALRALGLDRFGAKVISAPVGTMVVIELPPGWEDPDDDRLDRITAKFTERLERLGFGPPLILPTGTKIKTLPNGDVYHREKLGDYEVEIVAKDAAELQRRFNYLWPENFLSPKTKRV